MPVAGDVYRVAAHFTMPEQVDAYNVLGLKVISGTCTDAELLTAGASWMTTAYAYLQGVMHNQVDLADARVTKVVWSAGAWITDQIVGTIFPTFTAADGTDMLPHAVAPYVTFETLAPKRKGKIKLLGFSEANQADSLVAAGAATAMGNFANAITTVLSPGTALVYYAVLGNDGTARTAISELVRGVVGSVRRRRPGIGI